MLKPLLPLLTAICKHCHGLRGISNVLIKMSTGISLLFAVIFTSTGCPSGYTWISPSGLFAFRGLSDRWQEVCFVLFIWGHISLHRKKLFNETTWLHCFYWSMLWNSSKYELQTKICCVKNESLLISYYIIFIGKNFNSQWPSRAHAFI